MNTVSEHALSYQTPPDSIARLVDIEPTPAIRIDPHSKYMLFLGRPGLPDISVLAQEELRLAGLRIDPLTNGKSRMTFYESMHLRLLGQSDRDQRVQGLPRRPRIANVSWSPSGKYVAFTHTRRRGLDLYVFKVATLRCEKVVSGRINNVLPGLPYRWSADGELIYYNAVPANRPARPAPARIPVGPTVQTNEAGMRPARTFQDLLRNEADERLFVHYATSEIRTVNLSTRVDAPYLPAGIYTQSSRSPDGNYFLFTRIKPPFSYAVPYERFPMEINVYDLRGKVVYRVADLPLADDIPQGFGATRRGRRSVGWRADAPATLYWVEAQDDGDPRREVAIRDALFVLEAPFRKMPRRWLDYQLRYGGITWGTEQLAITYEWWWQDRRLITSHCRPANASGEKQIIFDRSWEDQYSSPGNFETTLNDYGKSVLLTSDDGSKLYLRGQGASPEGNRPFLDEYDLSTQNKNRLWRSEPPFYEFPIAIPYADQPQLLTRRESKTRPPNFFLRNWETNALQRLTRFPNPYEQLRNIHKEIVRYRRSDGVELTGTLYLPANFKAGEDAPLPTLMWAYPREFKSRDAAGQVTDSPYEFLQLGWWSPLPWITRGYAIFDDFSMPIVGEGEEEPNETFVEQLIDSAKAAVEELTRRDVTDPARIAVGGHSYGAFMTANLLAHTDLFAAGIARSGAYNRTLTPFGFQSEERTYWEAPQTYHKMSPFTYADRIKTPLLLIHGEADDNSGTYPMQSERFYGALKGHGATVRLVLLPHESHGYRARQSVMHMLWEMDEWLERFVKNRQYLKVEADDA